MDPLNVLPKFEIRSFPVPGIIGGTQKIWAVPGYAFAPFSPNFFMGFCSDEPCYCSVGVKSNVIKLTVVDLGSF